MQQSLFGVFPLDAKAATEQQRQQRLDAYRDSGLFGGFPLDAKAATEQRQQRLDAYRDSGSFGVFPLDAKAATEQRQQRLDAYRDSGPSLPQETAEETRSCRSKSRDRSRAKARKRKERDLKRQEEISQGLRDGTTGKIILGATRLGTDGDALIEKPHKSLEKKNRDRSQAKARKRKERDLKKQEEISQGLRDGTTGKKIRGTTRLGTDGATLIEKPHKPTNWYHPFLWGKIDAAARRTHFAASALVHILKSEDSDLFKSLWPSTVSHWIDKESKKRGWNSKTLRRVENNTVTHQRGRSPLSDRSELIASELEPELSSDSDSSEEMSKEPEKETSGEMGEMSEGSGEKENRGVSEREDEEVYEEVDEQMGGSTGNIVVAHEKMSISHLLN
ncbi:hypothetical protein MMC07_009866 [Pseudocyphellaria aurata]|nr:hypothetical protein [Pseudocyphellaria aurata]